MAASVRLELNSAGIRELLLSGPIQGAVTAKANEVAGRARSRGLQLSDGTDVPIEVREGSSESTRSRASVWIDHPAGLEVEAKDRLLGGSL